jgi:hypothetical protein
LLWPHWGAKFGLKNVSNGVEPADAQRAATKSLTAITGATVKNWHFAHPTRRDLVKTVSAAPKTIDRQGCSSARVSCLNALDISMNAFVEPQPESRYARGRSRLVARK